MKWLVALTAVGVLTAAFILTRSSKAIALSGIWSDGCPCQIPCPCWRTSRASTHDCQNVQVFFVERFRGDQTDLIRFVFIVVGRSKHPFEAPEPSVVYVQQGSDAKTVAAIENLVRRLLGDAASFEVAEAPVQHRFSASEHEVVIPGILTYRISSRNRDPDESVARHLYPWLIKPVQGVAKEVSYSRNGQSFRYQGTNALIARLHLEE